MLNTDMPASREISHNTLTESVAFQEMGVLFIGTDAFSLSTGRVCVTVVLLAVCSLVSREFSPQSRRGNCHAIVFQFLNRFEQKESEFLRYADVLVN